MCRGKVVVYFEARGFGFVQQITGNPQERLPELYFHINNVANRLTLNPGDLVCFEVITSLRKAGQKEAINVRLASTIGGVH